MVNRTTQQRIRKIHRFLGVFLGLQFLMWTISGLYFSWSNLDRIHGDHFKNDDYKAKQFNDLISPSHIEHNLAISQITLRDIAGVPHYLINNETLYNAINGRKKSYITKNEALAIAQERLNPDLEVKLVEKITEAGPHHEYREQLFPAYVISYKTKENLKAYVSITDGKFRMIRHRNWRWFDFLWMTHTMDYKTRDNMNTLLLRGFSLLGLVTVLSGFALWFATNTWFLKKN